VKFASFIADGRRTFGVVRDDSLIEASEAIRAQYADLRAVLAGDALADLAADSDGQAFDASSVEYLPTIPNPDKVICIGVNYRPHLEEMGRSPPDYPVMFVRFAGSQVGHKQPIVKSRATEQYDFEGELGVVIGRPARYVSRDAALDYIAGYTCFMDGTARDWQRHTTQFMPGKNFHRSGAMGPYLVSRDEIPPPSGHDKTALVVYQRADEPGSLISILQEFAARRINLSNLFSRPTKAGGLGDYCFIVYADGHVSDELLADAMRDLHAKQGGVKFMGSYPAVGAHAESVREHADARWREADDWIGQLQGRVPNS